MLIINYLTIASGRNVNWYIAADKIPPFATLWLEIARECATSVLSQSKFPECPRVPRRHRIRAPDRPDSSVSFHGSLEIPWRSASGPVLLVSIVDVDSGFCRRSTISRHAKRRVSRRKGITCGAFLRSETSRERGPTLNTENACPIFVGRFVRK